ncbi:hypothetical protein EJB05_13956, partial [Eragrostis curvula]
MEDLDLISRLPNAVLGEIVSLLPTKDGARTKVIAPLWRHLWRSAPLNFDLGDRRRFISKKKISGILSSHPGPGRRFCIPALFFSNHPAATLDGWLQSPALRNLQELEFDYGVQATGIQPPLPSSMHSLSATLRVASFSGCGGFPDGNNASALQFPVLKQLSLSSGSQLISLTTLMPNMKVLALSQGHLTLDVVINFMKCFPCLEKLYIESCMPGEKNLWFHKNQNLIGTLGICIKKIVLIDYRGNKSHINFAKFFVLNAKVLQSMILEVPHKISGEWIERHHRLLETKNRASRDALVDFVYHNSRPGSLGSVGNEVAHDLSTADPFVRLRDSSV